MPLPASPKIAQPRTPRAHLGRRRVAFKPAKLFESCIGVFIRSHFIQCNHTAAPFPVRINACNLQILVFQTVLLHQHSQPRLGKTGWPRQKLSETRQSFKLYPELLPCGAFASGYRNKRIGFAIPTQINGNWLLVMASFRPVQHTVFAQAR